MTRIISGRFRGKNIIAPRNLPVRPTTDFAKESLFNILNNHYYFEDIQVLDLFAGTGNISFEFASRACKNITAVDIDPKCIRFMEKTAEQMNIDEMNIVRSEVLDFLKRDFIEYDVVFADPPYDFEDYKKLVETVFLKNLLSKEGVLIIEHSRYAKLEELENFVKTRNYGKVCFSFFELPSE